MNFIIIFSFLIFVILSALHFYWAMGGKSGFGEALPQKENGRKAFIPSALASVVVGLGLLTFALISLSALPIFQVWFNKTLLFGLNLSIGNIFLLRAIGDFKYVGFSKKIKSTQFAQNDSWFYSPLCLLIATLNTWIAFYL